MLLDADVAPPQKSSFAGKLIVWIVVVLALLFAGGWYINQKQEAAAKVAAEQKAEREWLVKQKSVINANGLNLKRSQAELETVKAENSKPSRKGGKPIAQAKWSVEAKQRYANVQKEIDRIIATRDERIAEFKKRLDAYKGPWPAGEQRPTKI